MALVLVGGAFLSSFLSVLFDRMASCEVVDFICGQKITNGLLKKLEIKLLSVNKVLDDAEEKQIRDPTVRKWLDELKDVLYTAGDVLDEINTEALRRKLERDFGSSSTSWVQNLIISSPFEKFHKTLEPKIEEILGRLELIVSQKDVLGLEEGIQVRSQARTRESTSLLEDSTVYGRDEEKEAIVKLLLSDDASDDKLSVIPIVGMGGIGKTTLAQLVYNDVRVQEHFDVQAWVCVSEEFDILRITQSTYASITSQTCGIMELDRLQLKLKDALMEQKYLIVYDDVWNENYIQWGDLRRPFISGAHGSKIIVTTRIGGVASMMGTLQTHHLMQISEENCWLLFAKHAFKNADALGEHPDHAAIGRQIVKKCKGLPLAAKSLGGLLRSELNLKEWENILMNDIWELSDKELNILPALWLSYRYLPSHLKRCFAYCSIFPKDYQFRKSELVHLWMAEDLLQPNKKKTVEEVGEDYFDILISRSFFQHSTAANQSFFTMHDLINDLAKLVSGEFCFRLEDHQHSLNILRKTRHFSYLRTYVNYGFENFGGLYDAKYLHTILPFPLHSKCHTVEMLNKVLYDLLPTFQYLRVLNLSGYLIKELPSSIGNLIHLRQLELSGSSIEKLPDAICNLYNLQSLLLQNCEGIVQLPTNLGRLINLRHLNISSRRWGENSTYIEKMPPNMGKLKDLQFLTHFVLDKHSGHNIAELKELQQLHGTLCISGLDNIVNLGTALETNIMRDKKYLEELELRWSGDGDDSQKDRKVLEKLRPHDANLKKLHIVSYGGTRFPDWLGDPSFSYLTSVRLVDCKFCCLLPPLGQLPSLIDLSIKGLNEIVRIGVEFYGNYTTSCVIKPFRSLKHLTFENMLEWQEWCYEVGGGIFPNLCTLDVWRCPKVKKISLDHFPKLERLDLVELESFTGLHSEESQCPKFLRALCIMDCRDFVCFPYGGVDVFELKDLKIRYCPKFESFPEEGLPSNLESLEFDCNTRLYANRTKWGLRRLNSLTKLSIYFGQCEYLYSFPPEGMLLLPSTLTYLYMDGLRDLTTLEGKELRHLTSLETLCIMFCPKLQCLTDGLPTSLTQLQIRDCPLLRQRLQREKEEDWPKISHIPSIWIDEWKI